MKISTLSTVYSVLTSFGYTDETILQELYNEIHKGDKVKAEKAAVYEAAWPIVEEVLSDTPRTVAEIWESIEGNAPEGFTKSKLSYALTHNWAPNVVKVEGKVNAYRKA